MHTKAELRKNDRFFDVVVNVAQLLKEPVGATRRYYLKDIAGPDTVDELKGGVTLIRTNRGILARGTIEAKAEMVCSRCLVPTVIPLVFSMEEEFMPRIDIISGLPLPVTDEGGTLFIDEKHVLDLGEAIRQYFIMALPLKPLCRTDCAGLCPACGINLNTGTCACSDRSRPSYWSKLIELNARKGNRN